MVNALLACVIALNRSDRAALGQYGRTYRAVIVICELLSNPKTHTDLFAQELLHGAAPDHKAAGEGPELEALARAVPAASAQPDLQVYLLHSVGQSAV
jgi:hypothetical protein